MQGAARVYVCHIKSFCASERHMLLNAPEHTPHALIACPLFVLNLRYVCLRSERSRISLSSTKNNSTLVA